MSVVTSRTECCRENRENREATSVNVCAICTQLIAEVPRTLLQRAKETFPVVRGRMNYTNSEKLLVGPYGEIYPASHDANQAMNIKAEEVSDSEEKADPQQITIQEIKAEPEHCRNSENVLVDTYGETYPTPHNANQAMNVKAEAVSDAEEEEDPLAVTFPELKAEPENYGD
ncbi:uncharacterized protein LOC111871611 [Cryptotermes secundus]|uniref:uncharacterized protein LOC111871611 n=1 Tax=Cryptotermes secundus TaxID=105785 RepID=UPI000CD7B511|nr:uncharacterized protein LOC111871611 [Cryptotermes secundus]